MAVTNKRPKDHGGATTVQEAGKTNTQKGHEECRGSAFVARRPMQMQCNMMAAANGSIIVVQDRRQEYIIETMDDECPYYCTICLIKTVSSLTKEIEHLKENALLKKTGDRQSGV